MNEYLTDFLLEILLYTAWVLIFYGITLLFWNKHSVKITTHAAMVQSNIGFQQKIFVAYEYNGKTYQTSYITPIPTKAGDKVVFYIDPKNPLDIYWQKTNRSRAFLLISLGSVILVGFVLSYYFIYRKPFRKNKKSKKK